ncbi:MAG: ABC transporter ATP-binding protein [Chloroflexi bacterium]|nr:ABC transporter ATP-binding protein [Chloroflexota bacterium]
MSVSQPVIQTRNLCKALPIGGEQLQILENISLQIERSEMVAIVGPSGSGKSTLMGLIGGLDSPTSGDVIIDGVNVSGLGERALTRLRNEKIGFVFQTFNLVPTLNAIENVMLPMQFSRRQWPNARARAAEILTMLGLEDRLEHTHKQLSGGEQQRVAIARALANEPAILLCDEPTGNLDKISTGLVVAALFDVREQTNTTIVVVTHSLELAAQMDRQIELVDGRIVDPKLLAGSGTPDSFSV